MAKQQVTEVEVMKCRHCGQAVKAKAGHWQALAGYGRLFCQKSPTAWHEAGQS